MRYRIIQETQYDEFGAVDYVHYLIQYQKKNFFGRLVWRYVEYKVSDYDSYWVRTQFKTMESAQDYVEKVLIKGGAVRGKIKQIVKEGALSI